jgi:hypothetical protein
MSFLSKIFGIFNFSSFKNNAGKIIPAILLFASLGVAYFFFVYKPATEREHFINIYKEILIIRFVLPDTAKANPEIAKMIKQNGLNEREFNSLYNYYASNPEYFLVMYDSSRARAEREIATRKTGTQNNK